jgi:hypothetical protein
MALPHRVGGALVVLGKNDGQQERDPDHILSPSTYGPGNHEYFTSYPVTTPSNVVTKVSGTLGLTAGPYVQFTAATLPRNFLTIVCYKTELNHRYPDYAFQILGLTPTYSTQDIFDTYGYVDSYNEASYNATYSTNFGTSIKNSYITPTNVTNILEDPSSYTGNLRVMFPRWTEEAEWDIGVDPYEDAILVTLGTTGSYWQTRTGTESSPRAGVEHVDFISPWYVSRDPDSGVLESQLRVFCDFSYKFTAAGNYGPTPKVTYPVEYSIIHPWDDNSGNRYSFWVADQAAWQYTNADDGDPSYHYPTGAYRTVLTDVYPKTEAGVMETVNYESKATHGLFLDANGSCWNLGTVLEVNVYIWKAPPKNCFFPNNVTSGVWNGHSYAFTNWHYGFAQPSNPSGVDAGPYPLSIQKTRFPGPAFGHPGNRYDVTQPGLQYVETGDPTEVPYSIPSPNATNLHYWGCAFAPDYAHVHCEQVETRSFTVTISESNTYKCDGGQRDGVTYSAYGVKLEDIELPLIEGFITYIKDYEVISVTKAGEP